MLIEYYLERILHYFFKLFRRLNKIISHFIIHFVFVSINALF